MREILVVFTAIYFTLAGVFAAQFIMELGIVLSLIVGGWSGFWGSYIFLEINNKEDKND